MIEYKGGNMCNLCGNEEERSRERKNILYEADNLYELAVLLQAVANGRIAPHSDKAKDISIMARNSIRYLVEEWM